MAPSVTKVIYKHGSEDYIVIVNADAYKKWKEDKTIPLTDVVDSFNVFQSGQGAQGKLLKPSQQQLDTVFETHDDVEVITIILEKGDLQNSSAITTSATLNITRGSLGSVSVDRNKSSSGI